MTASFHGMSHSHLDTEMTEHDNALKAEDTIELAKKSFVYFFTLLISLEFSIWQHYL